MDIFYYIIGFIVFGGLIFEAVRIGFYGRRAVKNGERELVPCNHPENPKKNVLIVGDSMSRGIGASCPEKSFLGLLVRDFPHIAFHNYAQNALKINQANALASSIPDIPYDLAIIQLGGMDTLHYTNLTKFMNNLEKYITYIQHTYKCPVVFISVNNIGEAPTFRFPINLLLGLRAKRISQCSSEICKKLNVVHIPLFKDIGTSTQNSLQKIHFSDDKIHPNDLGYAIWYEIVGKILKPLL